MGFRFLGFSIEFFCRTLFNEIPLQGISSISPGIIVGPLAIEAMKVRSIYYLQAAVVWAYIGIGASFIVGLFGGYWIKYLRWTEVDIGKNISITVPGALKLRFRFDVTIFDTFSKIDC